MNTWKQMKQNQDFMIGSVVGVGIYESCPHCRAVVEIVYSISTDRCFGKAHHEKRNYVDDSIPLNSPLGKVCRIFSFEDFRTEQFRDRWKTLQELMK